MNNLSHASRAILGLGVDTSTVLQTGPIFDEVTYRDRDPSELPPTDAPAPAPNGEPVINGGYQPHAGGQPNGNGNGNGNGQGAPWLKWALVAAVAAGVGYGVYRVTQKESD